jgi:hypothetical protein
MARDVTSRERPLLPLFSLLDIQDRLLLHRNGRVTLVYRLDVVHEPALDDPEFEHLAEQLTHAWSALPERVSYQFLVGVDCGAVRGLLDEAFRPVPELSPRHRLYEAVRRANRERFEALTLDDSAGRDLLQARQHFLAVSFMPKAFMRHARARVPVLARRRERRAESAWQAAQAEADLLDRSVTRALLDLGVGHERCDDDAIARLLHAMLSPETAHERPLERLSLRRHDERDDLPDSVLRLYPFLADAAPLWELTDDVLHIEREHLRLGGFFIGVVTMKRLPDQTHAGSLVPLLRLPIPRYVLSFRVNVLDQAAEVSALAAASRMADAWKAAGLFGSTKREDPEVASLQRQKDAALKRVYETSQRLVGLSLTLVLFARSRPELDGHVRTALGAMAMARGLSGVRETYALLEAFSSALPGGPELPHALQKCDSPTASDLLPLYDFKTGTGRIPFLTPNQSLVLFDPWAPTQPSPHQLIFAGSGWGKSFALQYQLACYEAHCLAHGEPAPRLFLLDKGASYRRFLEVRGDDALYIPFTPEDPPGFDIFRFDPAEEPLEAHVSRLTWLLLDFLRVSEGDSARLELEKAVVQRALFDLYGGDGRGLASFAALEQLFDERGQARLAQALYPFRHGSLAALFRDDPRLVIAAHVNAICWDIGRLDEHPDMKRVALRLAIYQIRKSAYAAARRRQTTFLVIDEAWSVLSGSMGSGFVVDALRSGRKDGLGVILLSQQLEDFAAPDVRAAILGNVSSRLIGYPGKVNLGTFRELLSLNERQLEMIGRLRSSTDFREFLLVRNDSSEVVRVPGHALIERLFTTRHEDMAAWERLRAAQPDRDPLDLLRAWAGGSV